MQCPMDDETCTSLLVDAAVRAGKAVVHTVNSLPRSQRCLKAVSVLKPPPGSAALPDCVGEEAAFECLQQLADQLGHDVRVVVDEARFHTLSAAASRPDTGLRKHVWVYLDAVDGTVKVAGLGNEAGRLRAANDGAWAMAIAMTHPTGMELEELRLADFKVAVLVDGALEKHPSDDGSGPYPAVVVAAWQGVASSSPGGGGYVTTQGSLSGPRLFTTTNLRLNQSFVFLDAFQAFDRNSQQPEDEALAARLFACLINRNDGGAFDVLRTYGNLAALQRTMLGWRSAAQQPSTNTEQPAQDEAAQSSQLATSPADASAGALGASRAGAPERPEEDAESWLEPQAGGFLVVNENHANLIPAVPVILGAGGLATDFEGRPLLERRLVDGRCNVLYAGNATLHAALLGVIKRARTGGQ